MKNFLNYSKNRFLYNLIRFLIVLGLCLLASQFLLIQEVKALQTEPSAVQFYDNYGSYLTPISTQLVDNTYYGYLGLTANSTGGALGLRLNENIVNGHMYSLTLNIGVPAGGYTSSSSKNIIGIGSNLTNAVNSYVNANGSTISYTQGGTYEAPHYISFVFTAKVTGSYIVVPYNTVNGCLGSCENYFKGYTLNDLGSSDNLTDSEVNSIINNQTYVIQDSINNIENNINNTITDNFNNCGDNTITLTPREKGKYISDGYGNLNTNPYYNVSNFYNINPNSNYTINFNDITGLEYGYLCWYNDTSLVSCSQYRDMSGYSASNFVITSPSNANKITLTYRVNSNANISGNLCINRIDETNDKLDDLNSSINDESLPDTPDFSDLQMADDTPISDLILMPINYLNKLVNAFSGSCKTYVLDFGILGSDYNLSLPCIKPEKWLGSDVWNIIDVFGCFFMIYEIAMLAVSMFNDFTSMRDTYDSLYTPKHARPLGKHTSEVE